MKNNKQLAFVFPGQGSQSVGMMTALAERYPVVKSTFAEASESLGLDLWKLVEQGPETELNATARTQPVLLAAGVAVWRAWKETGGENPELIAGHSLGEYTALVCAKALTFSDAIQLVADRGMYMQAAVSEGTGSMAALPRDSVMDLPIPLLTPVTSAICCSRFILFQNCCIQTMPYPVLTDHKPVWPVNFYLCALLNRLIFCQAHIL